MHVELDLPEVPAVIRPGRLMLTATALAALVARVEYADWTGWTFAEADEADQRDADRWPTHL